MKRTALNHTKTKKLSRILKIPQYAAVGILECLWHAAANEAPCGDIGKLSDDDIALAIDWDREPKMLISALLEAGWLDVHKEYRLIVHDWPEHCEDTVDARVYRMGVTFADGSRPKGTKVGTRERKPINTVAPPAEVKPHIDSDFTPSEVAQAVIQDAQAGGMRALMTLTDTAKHLMGTGRSADQARKKMSDRWDEYKRSAERLKWTYSSIEKFFAGGMWDNPLAWPWRVAPPLSPDKRKVLA